MRRRVREPRVLYELQVLASINLQGKKELFVRQPLSLTQPKGRAAVCSAQNQRV